MPQDSLPPNHRRAFLKSTAAASAASLYTTNLFAGQVAGANNRLSTAFIGMGRMGQGNLTHAMRQDNVEVVAVCDVYEPNLNKAVDMTKNKAKAIKDFREVLADKSIDAVCISTPDHWHAYMTVEACKAGKDVYVEKPICVTVDEGSKMVQAARKYNRVVQAGTMQRSGIHFQTAAQIVKSGDLGQVTFVRTWNYGNTEPAGIGNPPDAEPPKELNWDMWLGPAPMRPFNANRFGIDPKAFSHFRWFWDYAGGMMTDWGIHLLDIVHMAFDEAMPTAITSLGTKNYIKDNRDTPDTLQVTYEYPSFIATYENRLGNANSMMGKGYGILFHGNKGTLFVDRSGFHLVPERGSTLTERSEKSSNNANDAHWKNFLECIRTRQRPISDVEVCQRSTTACLLGNVALRSKLRLDWDSKRWTTQQAEARRFLSKEDRKPWRIVV
ncbi:MAG: Gfo/Idh/MocA family oxidoreductase [Bryobacterales bacterium]|nr:Gfo/Idh/MocA family oxidoreductase [Bryobacterales bacterium]